VREGDVIADNQGVIELETDKAVVEVPCPHAGKIARIHVAKGQTVEVGQPVLSIQTEEATKLEPMASLAGPQTAAASAAAVEFPCPGPLPREEAAVLDGSEQDSYGPICRERMSKIRRAIAVQMVKAASTIPHVTNFDDADITELDRMRKAIPLAHAGEPVKLTAMPFVAKAVALALREHSTLNASFDDEKEEIIYKQYVNLGVAVDTPRGLVVPVIRNADRMDVWQIARELTSLAARARSAEFTIDELRGGTFTISNLGAVGGTYSTPIINHPEVAILLLGRARWMSDAREEKIARRLMMPLSLSYDHRIVDGAVAGRFLNDVIHRLQSPGELLPTQGTM
jgi:pyruvate dehydrogenase E2 component (dihydrolipoamide acetyltransferase)